MSEYLPDALVLVGLIAVLVGVYLIAGLGVALVLGGLLGAVVGVVLDIRVTPGRDSS